MRRHYLIFSLIIALTTLVTGCNDSDSNSTLPEATNSEGVALVSDPQNVGEVETATINQADKEDLLFMWEEEKLARDIYKKMYEKYGKNIFLNISKSEQTHMNSVKQLLDKLAIPTPVNGDSVGVFKDPVIVALYQELIARGYSSLYEAYQVGLDIELMDIEDLTKRIELTADPAIKAVYARLLEASYNHKTAFEKNL